MTVTVAKMASGHIRACSVFLVFVSWFVVILSRLYYIRSARNGILHAVKPEKDIDNLAWRYFRPTANSRPRDSNSNKCFSCSRKFNNLNGSLIGLLLLCGDIIS